VVSLMLRTRLRMSGSPGRQFASYIPGATCLKAWLRQELAPLAVGGLKLIPERKSPGYAHTSPKCAVGDSKRDGTWAVTHSQRCVVCAALLSPGRSSLGGPCPSGLSSAQGRAPWAWDEHRAPPSPRAPCWGDWGPWEATPAMPRPNQARRHWIDGYQWRDTMDGLRQQNLITGYDFRPQGVRRLRNGHRTPLSMDARCRP
jgi:hypothetical protein